MSYRLSTGWRIFQSFGNESSSFLLTPSSALQVGLSSESIPSIEAFWHLRVHTSPAVIQGGGQAELTPGHPCSHGTTEQGGPGRSYLLLALLAAAMLSRVPGVGLPALE